MKTILAILAAFYLAQSIEGGGPVVTPNPIPIHHSATYSGPGNVVSGAIMWTGLRAYNAAYATANGKLVNLKRSSDSHTCDILALSTGGMGNTANCSNSGDNGTAVATWCNATTCSATELYDQSSNTNCSSAACNMTQATAADQPTLVLSCIAAKPCLSSPGSGLFLSNSSEPNQSQPFTLTVEGENNSFSTSAGSQYFGDFVTSFAGIFTGTSANTVRCYAGTVLSAAANDNSPHAFVSIFNSTSSNCVVDGSATSGNAGTGGFSGGDQFSWMTNNGGLTFDGYMAEAGMWNGAFNSTQYGNMSTNMTSYY